MQLLTLRLRNFRNHADVAFQFGKGTNVLLGDNGRGKTNIIEAIAYLCLGKSFYMGTDTPAVKFGEDVFDIRGTLRVNQEQEHTVRVAYQNSTSEKVYTINGHQVDSLSSVFGRFPIVILSPHHMSITNGGPMERRRFIDFVISQSNTLYFEKLLTYKRVIRHRNKILLDAKLARKEPGTDILPWDEQLVESAGYLMMKRKEFVDEFQHFITTSYHHLVGNEEEPIIEYQSATSLGTHEEETQAFLRAELQAKNFEEKRIGSTLVGPHRDEFILKINGQELRKFASQGQHKTFLIALKIGEFFYLKERRQETPIMLLDDVFSELDGHRAERLLNYVGELSQTFVTTTNPHYFDETMTATEQSRIFHFHEGNIVLHNTVAA